MRLFGKNSVIERLRTNPSSIKRIYMQDGLGGFINIKKKAKQHNVPFFSMPRSKMDKICRNKNSQGVFVDVEDAVYMQYDEMLEIALDKKRCLIFLDGLKDPQNLGAIIRSAACLGRFSIVLPTHESASITEAVLRVASGGDNYVQVAKVANINNAIKKAKRQGFWIMGAVVKAEKSMWDTDIPFPLGLVIGSEQKGIKDVVKKNLDIEVTIPMVPETMSFNAAHAATILCYEVMRQRYEYKKSKTKK